jgi:hypothetical protein
MYNLGGCSLHKMSTKALTQIIFPGEFRVTWPFLEGQFFLFIKSITIFLSQALWHILSDFVADSFLYNFGECSLHKLKPKALTQKLFSGDFKMAWSFFGLLYVKCISVRKRHHVLKPSIMTLFFWFRCRFDIGQLWRVSFAQGETQSSNLKSFPGIFPHGMVIFGPEFCSFYI